MMTSDKLRATRNVKIIRKIKSIEMLQDQLENLRCWAHRDFGITEKSTKQLTKAINALMDAAWAIRQFEEEVSK